MFKTISITIAMATENQDKSNITKKLNEQPENRQELNRKTSLQFIISISIGVILLVGIVALGYFRFLRV